MICMIWGGTEVLHARTPFPTRLFCNVSACPQVFPRRPYRKGCELLGRRFAYIRLAKDFNSRGRPSSEGLPLDYLLTTGSTHVPLQAPKMKGLSILRIDRNPSFVPYPLLLSSSSPANHRHQCGKPAAQSIPQARNTRHRPTRA